MPLLIALAISIGAVAALSPPLRTAVITRLSFAYALTTVPCRSATADRQAGHHVPKAWKKSTWPSTSSRSKVSYRKDLVWWS